MSPEASALGAWVRATAVAREVVFELNDVGRLIDGAGNQVTAVTCPALDSIAPTRPPIRATAR